MHTKVYTPDDTYAKIVSGARYADPHRAQLRCLVAYLAIRFGAAWLDASPDVLEGWLPPSWAHLTHHELIAYLNVQGITPEHCTLAVRKLATATRIATTMTMSDDEIERAAQDSETGRLAAAWWAWHDATSRTYATMAEARAACGAWVRGESDEGPTRTA